MKRGRYVGMRRFRVRGQRTPEVNKVALIALKYFNALIAATLIASINALTLTALKKTYEIDALSSFLYLGLNLCLKQTQK